MSAGFIILSAVLVIFDLLACMVIAWITKGKSRNAQDYFIAGKKTGTVLLTLTAWASFSGAGNFIGQAGRGAIYGVSAYWLWLGESLLGGIVMGALIAPYLARFSYISMPHYIADYLCGGSKYVRIVGGLAALMPNVVWSGAQIMGISYVLTQVFNIDYRVGVVVCGIVLIVHTTTGGVNAVIYADALHGVLQMLFAVLVIFYGLKTFNFDIKYLEARIVAIDPGKWDFFAQNPVLIITSFFTGFVGATSNPIFWNRAFVAKDVKTARKSYGITFFFNIIMVFLIILIGIAALTFNTGAGDQALVWLILNKMPALVKALLAVGVFAACMSCADTHLNCAAANIVSDIIDPEGKLPPEMAIRYAKIATVLAGIVGVVCGLYADYIYALGTYGYTVCGGALIPLFVVGLCMRDKKSDVFKSKMDVRSAKIGITLGVATAIAFEIIPSWHTIFGGGVIPAIFITAMGVLAPNSYYARKRVIGKAPHCGDTPHIQ
jgi:Na+/proline symporter